MQEGIVTAWVSFVAALEDLLQSIPSAQVSQKTERSLVVHGRVMHAPEDAFRIRTVSITAQLVEGGVIIRCLIQKWNQPPKGHPLTIESEQPIDYRIDGANLFEGNKQLTPFQAAESLLWSAFKT